MIERTYRVLPGRDDRAVGAEDFSDALTTAGIHNVYFEWPGTAHEWLTWRRCFKDFVLVFFAK